MHFLYHYLHAQGFVKRDLVGPRVAHCTNAQLDRFFEGYVEQSTKQSVAYETEIGATDIYPDSQEGLIPLPIIKQLAVYAHHIYIHDPLLELAMEWNTRASAPTTLLHFGSTVKAEAFYRAQLVEHLQHLLLIEPLVKARVVRIIPTFFARPYRDPSQMYLDDFYGVEGSAMTMLGEPLPSELPVSLRTYCREHVHVVPVRYNADRKPILYPSENLVPRRAVGVYFDQDGAPFVYHLGQVEADAQQEGVIHTRYAMEEATNIDEVQFWNWVQGVKRRVIENRVGRLQQDLITAAQIHARFLTSSPVSNDIATLDLSLTKSRVDTVNTALLHLELPYFDNASIASLAKARQDEIAFEEFRLALMKAFQEIQGLNDQGDIQQRTDEILRDIVLIPLKKIDRQMHQFQRSLFPGAVLTLGSLATAILLSGISLTNYAYLSMAGVVAGGTLFTQSAVSTRERKAQLKQLPAFFYWQATQRQRKTR